MSEFYYARPSTTELKMKAIREAKAHAGLGSCDLLTINLDQDISKKLAMLRGIDYARGHDDDLVKVVSAVVRKYMEDVKVTEEVRQNMKNTVVNVIFNDPATIVFWGDGTKTVVKAEGEPFDPEKGLAMAIAKHHLGNNWSYYNVFKHWLRKGARYEYKANQKVEEETK